MIHFHYQITFKSHSPVVLTLEYNVYISVCVCVCVTIAAGSGRGHFCWNHSMNTNSAFLYYALFMFFTHLFTYRLLRILCLIHIFNLLKHNGYCTYRQV